jgi:hypothetical protein
MNRRGFLESLLGGTVAAAQLDIEKLLWVPGEKKIFIPPVVIPPDFGYYAEIDSDRPITVRAYADSVLVLDQPCLAGKTKVFIPAESVPPSTRFLQLMADTDFGRIFPERSRCGLIPIVVINPRPSNRPG